VQVAVDEAGRRDARGVVEVVVPQRVDAAVAQKACVLRLVLADDDEPALTGGFARAPGELGDDVLRRVVGDRLDRVEPEAIHVVLGDPVGRVAGDEVANLAAREVVTVAPLGARA